MFFETSLLLENNRKIVGRGVELSVQVDPGGLETFIYLFFFVAVLFGCSKMSDALVGFSLHHSKENHLAA